MIDFFSLLAANFLSFLVLLSPASVSLSTKVLSLYSVSMGDDEKPQLGREGCGEVGKGAFIEQSLVHYHYCFLNKRVF